MQPFIQDSSYLLGLERVRVSEGRNLENGLRLDRNERVENWGSKFLLDVFSNAPEYLLSTYPDQSRLYSLLSEYHNIPVSQLLLTSGIDGGLKTLFELLLRPGDLIGVLSPTYAMYKVYSDIYQVNIVDIGYKSDFSFDFHAVSNFIDKRPKVFFLPNPNQPIEDTLSLHQLSNIAQHCLECNTLLVVDEAYHLFGSESSIPLVSVFPNIVVTRTFSKAFGMPSIRLGYLISTPANLEILSKSRLAHESNSLSNFIAEYLLLNYHIVQDYIDLVVDCRVWILKYFKSVKIDARCQFGNYVLLNLESPARCLECVNFLRDKQIYVKGPWKAPYSQYITITLGPQKSMLPFIEAFSEFCI